MRIARAPYAPRWYFYAWRGGPQIASGTGAVPPRLTEDHLAKIIAAKEAARAPDSTTMMAIIRSWRLSPEWDALAAGTKKTWGAALRLIEEKWGDTPLVVWNDPRMVARVVAWRDSRRATPRGADIGVTVLRALLEHGRLRGRVSMNAALNIPHLYRSGTRAEIIWTDEDINKFSKVAEELGLGHVVDGLLLGALTGLRRADLVTVSWDHVGEYAITKKALKRSSGKRQYMSMPRIPALDSLLKELRGRHRKDGVETLLVNSYGDSWSGDGFGTTFNRIRDAAGIAHLDEESGKAISKHLHDLRGTFCTKLLTETDLSDREVAEIMGWAPDKVAAIRKVYVDQSKVSAALGARLKRLGAPRPHVPNPKQVTNK